MYPLVSVIIPVYNVEPYVEKCLISLCNQTYEEIEIIVVDDGSTDQSGEISNNIARKDNRISVYHIANGGVARARNYGIEVAKGEYIVFSDSDDILEENYIKKAVSSISDAEYVSCAFETINEKNKTMKIDYMSFYGKSVLCTEYLKEMSKYQAGAYWGANWGKLYKSNIIKKFNIRFESDVGFAEDFRFNLEYLKYVNKVALIHDPVYYYRIDTRGSLSKKGRDLDVFWQEYFELYCRYKDLYRLHGILEESKVRLSIFLIEIYVAIIRQGICHEKMKLHDVLAICKRLDSNPEIVDAANLYKEMTGRPRYYAKLIANKKSVAIIVILKIVKILKGR